jgi:hypothetical protein
MDRIRPTREGAGELILEVIWGEGVGFTNVLLLLNEN